ncbi:MAG: PA2169 family four-helix-bundle protein [Brevundimonas sp.]|nr:MAG: PA2169 family four-helix-bundle protein [Brevundimonas sp.]
MTNANSHDIHVLNGLIRATIDSADGYREAATGSSDPGHQDLFQTRDGERRQVAEELSTSVRALGGDPTSEGSLIAKAQRAFGDVSHALLRDELSVVAPVESAEDVVRARFEKALEDSHISALTRDAIRRAWMKLDGGHEAVRDIKHRLEGQRDAGNRLFPQ